MTERDAAYRSLKEKILPKAKASIAEEAMKWLRRGKQWSITLKDGTPIAINHYQTDEQPHAKEPLDHLSVTVIKDEYGSLTFGITKNGLTGLVITKESGSTGLGITQENRKQAVRELGPHPHPPSHKNLEVTYPEVEQAKSPLEAFRGAAKPLVDWLIEITKEGQFKEPPVSIREKTFHTSNPVKIFKD